MTLEPLDSATAPDGQEPLRRAFARVPDDGPGGFVDEGDCPEPDTIWAAVHSELRVSEIEAIVLHTASCARCAEEWRLAREIGDRAQVDGAPSGTFQTSKTQPSPVIDDEAPSKVLSMGHRFRRVAGPLIGLAAAAALLLMVGWPDREGPVSELRTSESLAITSEVTPDTVLARDECRLAWSEIPGATYSLLVSDTDLAVVTEALDLDEPQFTIPSESLAHLATGAELYWQVEAHLPDGSSQRSPTFVARLD